MKKPHLEELKYSRRKPIELQDIQKPLCEEFGQNSTDQLGQKVGFDALNSLCKSCGAAMACLELGGKIPRNTRIKMVKNAFGLSYFYDENKIQKLGHIVIEKLYKGVAHYSNLGQKVPIEKFDAGANKLILRELQSEDDKILPIIKEVLSQRGVVFDKTEVYLKND